LTVVAEEVRFPHFGQLMDGKIPQLLHLTQLG
jgi:hypothetical protein